MQYHIISFFISVYIPDIARSPENYLGNFTSTQLGGTAGTLQYQLYAETSIKQPGFKKAVRGSGSEFIWTFQNRRVTIGPYRGKYTDGSTSYGYWIGPEINQQGKIWYLYKYGSTGAIDYNEQYYDGTDNKWKWDVQYNFDAQTMTWKKV